MEELLDAITKAKNHLLKKKYHYIEDATITKGVVFTMAEHLTKRNRISQTQGQIEGLHIAYQIIQQFLYERNNV